MTNRTGDEIKQENIGKMGDELGALYSALWQELAIAHLYWHEYVELFGAKPERVDVINKAAPAFFRMLQDELWEMSLLYLARLTDAPHTFRHEDKSNLSIQALLPLTRDHIELNSKVSNLIQTAIGLTKFARDWRNRRIAHRDPRSLQRRRQTRSLSRRIMASATCEALSRSSVEKSRTGKREKLLGPATVVKPALLGAAALFVVQGAMKVFLHA